MNREGVSAQVSRVADDWSLDRRSFLRAGASAGVLLLGAGGLLSGCSGKSSGPVNPGEVRVGGTLTAGMTGGGSAEALDAHNVMDNLTMARLNALYSNLVRTTRDGRSFELALAQEMIPNADATEWTILLKDGPRFHDGRPVTARDVVASFKRIVENDYPGKQGLGPIDLNKLSAVDDRTLKIAFTAPFAVFQEMAAAFEYNLYIVPEDYDPNKPIGSGPFVYESFEPGAQSVFTRNTGYWEKGAGPYVDKLAIVSYQDETAQTNALLSGQVDMINALSRTSSQVEKTGGRFQNSPSGSMSPFVMNVAQAPWNDERVRAAMRLICNRAEIQAQALGGDGEVANDLYSPLDSLYDDSIPQREKNIAKAKALLREAGRESLEVDLVTRPAAPGMVQSAQVLAEQAKAAGVTINVRQVTSGDFYAKYGKWNFCQSNWSAVGFWAQTAMMLLPDSPYNDSGFDDPEFTKLYQEAIALQDSSQRAELAAKMQQIFHERGSLIIPAFRSIIDGYAGRVGGAATSPVFSFNNYRFQDFWVAA